MTATVDDLRRVEEALKRLTPEKKKELLKNKALQQALKRAWLPNPGQQQLAYNSPADELFYGGSAGGGKTDFLLGYAATDAKRSLVLRRTNKEASRFIRRFSEIVGTRDGWNGQNQTFSFPDGRLVEFGGCQLDEDKQKYKGEPKDFIGFDEISDFTESQYRFIIGWNRSADKNQRCRVICAGNPPTTAEGLWVVQYWAPWLDETHPNPAKQGELRWFTTIAGKDTEVDGPGPHLVDGEMIRARSRTFIRAVLDDNPDLSETDYNSVLASLPEGLREAYKEGKFTAHLRDADMQVIPSMWIIEAQDRWKADGWKDYQMTAMGVDCAGGGNDEAVIAMRHGGWYNQLVGIEGSDTADGSAMAGRIFQHRKHGCPIIIDVGGGYAGAILERLKDNSTFAVKFDGTATAMGRAQNSGLMFANKRAEAWWRFREALDPDQEGGSPISLPPDPQLRGELAAPRYKHEARGIIIEKKDDIKKRIGRSTNRADAVVMCFAEGNRAATKRNWGSGRMPKAVLGYSKQKHKRSK